MGTPLLQTGRGGTAEVVLVVEPRIGVDGDHAVRRRHRSAA